MRLAHGLPYPPIVPDPWLATDPVFRLATQATGSIRPPLPALSLIAVSTFVPTVKRASRGASQLDWFLALCAVADGYVVLSDRDVYQMMTGLIIFCINDRTGFTGSEFTKADFLKTLLELPSPGRLTLSEVPSELTTHAPVASIVENVAHRV